MGIRMKIIPVLAFCAVLLLSGCATAQNFPQRTINGDNYYVYSVEPGNTLFAISRLFSVEVADLIKANPDAKEGLSIGQEIYVPIKKIDRKTARRSDIEVEGEYILHTAQRKETLFSIASKYGVSVNKVIEHNPEYATSLSIGDVVKIPSDVSTMAKDVFLEPARNDTFMVHQVQKGETIYGLAKEYGITTDSLSRANNNFESGMKTGQWIIIPKYKESYLAQLETETTVVDSAKTKYPVGEKKSYNIGVMLPFELAYNDSLEKALTTGKELYILTEIALDYYRGVKIALDSLKKLGFSAKVYVYDVGEDIVGARDVLARPEIKSLDIIFGPMHKASLAIVSEATRKNGTYLVSPNSFSNEVFKDNPYMFRSQASHETLLRYMGNYVAIQHPNDNVIMINSESSKDWPYRKLFKENYNKALGSFPNAISDSLRSVGISLTEAESTWLRKDVLNVLVVPSNELAFVSDFMTRLSRVSRDYQIQVYGLENWIKYDNIEAAYKNRFKLRLVMPNYVDYNNESTIDFLKKYRQDYKMEPTSHGYGYAAYDLMMYFGEVLMKYGLGFPSQFEDFEMRGVNGNYRFGKSTSGQEYENKAVYVIEYENYQIKIIN